MVYVAKPSWNISYYMKPWLEYANEGFDGGFNTKSQCWGLDYMDVGKNCVDVGKQGGTINTPWDGGETSPNFWSIIVWDSFVGAVGCLHGLALWVHHDMEEQAHPVRGRYALCLVLQHYIIVCFGWRF